jgi:peptidoglycan/xylan/chitin deacetylase (PgdA/CDA1 family)
MENQTMTIGDITLSFDNGPTVEVTPLVLDVLARPQIKASFFVLGKKLQTPQTQALMHRAAGEGHWIGNHTFTHSVPLGRQAGDDVAQREIGRTQDCLEGVVHPDRLFRPFGGGGVIGDHLLSAPVLRHLSTAAAPAPVDSARLGRTRRFRRLAQYRRLPGRWSLHDYDTADSTWLTSGRAEGARFNRTSRPTAPLVARRAPT